MIVHIAVPVHYLRCKVWTDETRDWSVVHEVILLDLARTCLTLDALCEDTLLPRQVVIAALARLMRHKLVEVASAAGCVFFGASTSGAELRGVVSAGAEDIPIITGVLRACRHINDHQKRLFMRYRHTDGVALAAAKAASAPPRLPDRAGRAAAGG